MRAIAVAAHERIENMLLNVKTRSRALRSYTACRRYRRISRHLFNAQVA